MLRGRDLMTDDHAAVSEPFSPSDGQIVDGLRAGSSDAWAALYEAYYDRVRQLARRMIGPDRAAVADVVQDTFLSAAGSAGTYDPSRGPLWLWLAGVVRNRVGLYFRSRHRHDRDRQGGDAQAADTEPWADRLGRDCDRPEAEAISAESVDLVRATLAGLPDEYQAMLIARYLEDTPVDDLARHGGISVEAMRSRLARARQAFREGWGQPGPDAEEGSRPAVSKESRHEPK